MQRALLEAERARGRTRPNPMVGCVVTRGTKIIAVGHHVRAGSAHAEVVALRRAGEAARGADVYVTLEPCAHQGRTGPCTDALIEARVGRVIVGARDPNPLVNGRGIRRLRAAGIDVQVGLLGAQCRRLNEAFEFTMRHGRPWVVAKVAQSLDGRIATRTGVSQWITGPQARRMGHTLRNTLDAILVGAGTVRADDPRLTCRVRGGRDPVRVVLDGAARLPPDAKIFTGIASSIAPTWICVSGDAPAGRCRAMREAGAEVICCGVGPDGRLDLHDVLEHLRARDVLSVLVEGGPTVLGSFFDAHLVNKLYAFVAPMIIGGREAPSSIGGEGVASLLEAAALAHVDMQQLGDDYVLCGDVVARRLKGAE